MVKTRRRRRRRQTTPDPFSWVRTHHALLSDRVRTRAYARAIDFRDMFPHAPVLAARDIVPILLYVAGAAGAGVVGGALASVLAPGRQVTSYIQHFAAGVVVAAVALEVMPDVERSGAPPVMVLGGFALGGIFMIGVKWVTLRLEERERQRRGTPWGLAAAAAIDTAVDGAIIGTGFAMASDVGLILTAALALELFFLTLSVGSSFREERASHGLTIVVTSAISLLLVAGAVVGIWALAGASRSFLAAVLSFGAAALLYLVTEELLIESHLQEETLTSTAMFFLGFLAIFAFVALGRAGTEGPGGDRRHGPRAGLVKTSSGPPDTSAA